MTIFEDEIIDVSAVDPTVGYRNAVHIVGPETQWRSVIRLDTWNKEGKPITQFVKYNPHLYYRPRDARDTEFIQNTYKTVTKKKLCYREFESSFKRKKWIEENPEVPLYDAADPTTGFLQETFAGYHELPEFSQFPLKVYGIDIETTIGNSFPSPENPTDAITVLTVGDLTSMRTWTWVLLKKPWKKDLTEADFPNTENKEYFTFGKEYDMYIHFLNWFKHHRPDIVTGWNIHFDIPFIVNRMKMVIGEDDDTVAKAFSPIGKMYSKTIVPRLHPVPINTYEFSGLCTLDMLMLYRDKFCLGAPVVNFKLDTVCSHELGVGKLHYEGTMKEFYHRDFKQFVEYNIIDVVRVLELEKKKKLLQLTRYLTNIACITPDRIFSLVGTVLGALAVMMRSEHKALIITNDRIDPELKSRPFEGAYVYAKTDYKSGPFASFDLNSLYPSIIRSINISPETLIGKVLDPGAEEFDIHVYKNKKSYHMTKEQFREHFGPMVNIAANGSLFLKQEQHVGMCALFEEKFYNGRKATKKKMIKKKQEAAALLKEILKDDKDFNPESYQITDINTDLKKEWHKIISEAEYLDISQTGQKTNLNSLYGLFSSKFSNICSVDCAEAITLSGQYIIKESMSYLTNEMAKIADTI